MSADQSSSARAAFDERAVRHLRLLSETVAAVTGSLDLGEVTEAVAVSVARAMETDACFVYAFDEAADEFLKWTKAGGRVLPGLVKRRNDERALYLSGVA